MEYAYSEALATLAKLIAEQTIPSFELWEPVADIVDWTAGEHDSALTDSEKLLPPTRLPLGFAPQHAGRC